MYYIIIISIVAVYLLGFNFIDRISILVDPTDFSSDLIKLNLNESDSNRALVFGSTTISKDIVIILEKYNIIYTLIADTNELNKSNSYKYLFAVDEIDLENLMICSIGKKLMGITNIMALCNCSYNKKIYDDNNIPYLWGDNISASQFVSALITSSHKSGGKSDVHF